MKTLKALCLAALTATAAFAADFVPSFNATLTIGKDNRFVLVGVDGKASSWLGLGDTFQGYTLKAYDAKTSTLDLEKDGKVTHLVIAGDAAIADAPAVKSAVARATVAEATELLDKMQFEKTMERTLAVMRKAQTDAIKRMLPQNLSPEEREAASAMQEKVLDQMMSALSDPALKSDVAKIYTEVFSKDELQQLSGFYASSLGQTLLDKQPELVQKTNEAVMPRIMAIMPKIQQMQRDFAVEMRAKKQAAQPAQPAPTPASVPAAAPTQTAQ